MNSSHEFWLTRLVFQRGLGLVYLIAFVIALNQFRPLLGERGLLPVPLFVKQIHFMDSPSLFYFCPKDWAFTTAAWIGIVLSTLTVTGISERYACWFSALVWGLLWALYLSFVNVGQTFYAFGWESILLEAGFYTIFLGPASMVPPKLIIYLLRWLEFRIMFGAGLIKIRGDACWRDLTCLDYHYETQPMPNPLSWYFHWAPEWTHQAGVAFNHVAELVAPLGYFSPWRISTAMGLVTIIFQGMIMASGNLSFLNFLTLILAIPLLDDRFLASLISMKIPSLRMPPVILHGMTLALVVLVIFLSLRPIGNMLSPQQIMNTNFNPFHLVGTYGAFGSITRPRYEVIIEGTNDSPASPSAAWRAYEFKGKPGDPSRRPPQIAPYHLRIDWLMWFAAMGPYYQQPWFLHLMAKLLEGDKDTLSLLGKNPFPEGPPRYIRAELYEYHFTTPEEKRQSGHWWKRQILGPFFPAVSLDMPPFRQVLDQAGWTD